MSFRKLMLLAVRPVSKLLAKFRLRYGAPTLTYIDFYTISRSAQPGDLLLTRTKWRPSNLFIPGWWSHVLLFKGGPADTFIEATTPTCQESSLFDVLGKADFAVLVRVKGLTDEERKKLPVVAEKYLGRPYDFLFEPSAKELYCSELVFNVYKEVLGGRSPIKRKEVAGEQSITPQDLFELKQIEVIYDSR